jgi:hypothetical protein
VDWIAKKVGDHLDGGIGVMGKSLRRAGHGAIC